MEWISIEDRLPEIGEPVICYYPNAETYKVRELVRLIHNFNYYWDTLRGLGTVLSHNPKSKDLTVTHWMPLPAPPHE